MTSGTTVTGPMDVVPTFTVPTLDGTFTFQNKWTGEDVYLFMFKYTDSNGNSNSATWSTILVPSSGISQRIRICSMGRLIQVITMIFFQERAMLKLGLILVKKSSGMVEYTTSIWMRATYKVDLVR